MGVVYAAHDGVRDEAVALKTLLRARPADVSRLKREFRSLADIAHLNLVCLHELVVEPETLLLHDGAGGRPECVGVRAGPGGGRRHRRRGGANAPIPAWSGACPAAARRGSVGAARQGQAPSRHQAVQHHGQARRTPGHPRLRPDERRLAGHGRRGRLHGRHASLSGARAAFGRRRLRRRATGTPSASRCTKR